MIQTRHRLLVLLAWLELLLLASILTLYGLYAFRWSNLGQVFQSVWQSFENPAGFISGCIFWVVLELIIFLFGLTLWITDYDQDTVGNSVLFAIGHTLYHLARWPIFAALMVASLGDSVNVSIAQVAVWFDLICIGCVGCLLLVGASALHCCPN